MLLFCNVLIFIRSQMCGFFFFFKKKKALQHETQKPKKHLNYQVQEQPVSTPIFESRQKVFLWVAWLAALSSGNPRISAPLDFFGGARIEGGTPDETAFTLSLTSRKSRNPAQQSALGILSGALAVGEAASLRLKKTRWGWQRGGERKDARDTEAKRQSCGRRFRPHSLAAL